MRLGQAAQFKSVRVGDLGGAPSDDPARACRVVEIDELEEWIDLECAGASGRFNREEYNGMGFVFMKEAG